ncbi:MAG: Fis family transcriptional regulator [Rhodoferax sp.]
MKPLHIADCVRNDLQTYLRDLGPSRPSDLYAMLITVVERPLLEVVMAHADNNQSRAAQYLGLNRNTLRKKLIAHKLLKE